MISKELKDFVVNFTVAGGTAAVSKTLLAPLERVKLIRQNQESSLQVIRGQAVPYKNALDCLIRIPREQGYLSFWWGNGVSVLRYFPLQALNFAFNEVYAKHLTFLKGQSGISVFLFKFLTGGLAGVTSAFLVYPLQFCQTRLAMDIGGAKRKGSEVKVEREFEGLRHCLAHVYKVDGMAGWYRGINMACLGIFIYRAMYFGMFDNLKRLWSKKSVVENKEKRTKIPVTLSLVIAQTVSCGAGLVAYPLDTVSRRMMLDSGRAPELRQFKNTLHAFHHIYKAHGFIGFYQGSLLNCFRAGSGALVLVFYDEVLEFLAKHEWYSICDNCR